MESKDALVLLEEIRDVQRQHLEAYSRASDESIAIQWQGLELQLAAVEQQKVAVAAQARHLRLYRNVVLVAAPIVAFLVWTLTGL